MNNDVHPSVTDEHIVDSVHPPPEFTHTLLACCKRAGRHRTWHRRNRSRLLRVKLDVLAPERRSGVHLCGRLFWVSDFFALGLWAGLLARLRAPTTQQQSAMVVAMEASVAPKKVIIDTDPGIGRPKSQTHSLTELHNWV